MADSTDDEIIELTQMVDEEASEAGEILELDQVAEDLDALVPENAVMPEVTELQKAEAPGMGLPEAGGPGTPFPAVTQEQLDAAIERVIEKKFAQRIEKILFEVTETVIKREIAEIKAGLQKDLDDIDNA